MVLPTDFQMSIKWFVREAFGQKLNGSFGNERDICAALKTSLFYYLWHLLPFPLVIFR